MKLQPVKKILLKLPLALAGLVFVAALSLVSLSAKSNSGLLVLAGLNQVAQAQGGGGSGIGSYGYHNPYPQAYLYVQSAVYSKFLKRWDFQIGYTVQNVKSGLVTMGQNVIANHISHNGSVGVLLNPNTTYTFKFYQDSNGNGPVLSTLTFTTLPPPSYGYK